MGLSDYLGSDWKSKVGIPIVNMPGCPVQPDNFMETLLYLLRQGRGQRSADDPARRRSCGPTLALLGETVHEGKLRSRAVITSRGILPPRSSAETKPCIVKLGCWGPVVQCNVGKRGWMNGIGGCPNVGGICIGCTMPGFPDKFMSFMDQPPGSMLSSQAIQTYGKAIRALRAFTQASMNKEPVWRKPAGPIDILPLSDHGALHPGTRRSQKSSSRCRGIR